MKNILRLSVLALLAIFAAGLAKAQIPSGYYDGLEGLSGVSLKKAVKNTARSHTVIEYGQSTTWPVFLLSDTRIVNGQRVWWDMYSNNNVPAPNYGSHDGLNIEHSVANSWWGGTKNDAYKDLMHLNPSNSDANSRKSNYPLGKIQTETWNNGVTFVGKPKSGDCGGASYVYEPADEYKGDFARVFFYMFTIYDDIAWKTSSGYGYMYDTSSSLLLKPWAYQMLLEWAKNDPVSQKEIDRNNVIYQYQHNRNPFIDYPELAEHIWGSKSNQPFHLDGRTDPDPDPEPDPDPDPDVPGVTPSDEYWYAVTSTADLNENDNYVIVASNAHYAMSSTSNTAGVVKHFSPTSKEVSIESYQSKSCIKSIPTDAAVIKLIKSGNSWILAVYNTAGEFKGYLYSAEAKSVMLTDSQTTSGTAANLTVAGETTRIQYPVGGSNNYLQYNASTPRFTTYTSTQEAVQLYRQEASSAGLGTGLEQNAEEVIYGIYDISGRALGINDLSEAAPGLYIVVSNVGSKKILVTK